MSTLVDMLIDYGLAIPHTIRPCTSTEVAAVSTDQQVLELPPQYEQFLLTMGRQAGDLLRGTDFFYPSILGLPADMREFLREEKAQHLFPAGAIAIGMHQGYQVYWLSPTGEVSWYSEGDQYVRRIWPTLLDFLRDEAVTQRKSRDL